MSADTTSGTGAGTDAAIAARAATLVACGLVWDNHACMPLRPHDVSFLPQLERHRAAGADVVMLNVGFGETGIEDHVRMLASMRDWLARHRDRYRLIESIGDIAAARAAGQLAVGFDIEGANAIDDQISLVRLYRDLGVRWMLIAYNRNNRAGGGCQDEDGGLTDFGRRMIDAMEEVGMVVCCTHAGPRTAREAMAHARGPTIFSHSNPRALREHPRNIGDELVRACAAKGGVVGINGIALFLNDRNEASARAVAEHVDHVVQLVGARHAGLGLDFVFDQEELNEQLRQMKHTFPDGFGYEAGIGMVAPEAIPEIVEQLLRRGYRDEDVLAILGGNWMRVAEQVWKD
ncbi:membrane dipeptidase [Mitsuaria sp. GD03876]|uniref:dipeptidase n=1 Tax=Mitsuaria sp. GD03876 TaxID=2975399 RepID=UPI00244CCBD4|nr:membrane dipeptidase [Mitsuaria sp. GD03876]MDH0866508.1 dipeptidase [Mitsuaria sp. GD03876]